MHSQMEQRTALQNGGSRFHSRNRSRSGDCIGIHASGVWCKPQKILHRVERDHRHQEESYKEIFRVIILVVSPIILSAFVYNVNAYINGYLSRIFWEEEVEMRHRLVFYMQSMLLTL